MRYCIILSFLSKDAGEIKVRPCWNSVSVSWILMPYAGGWRPRFLSLFLWAGMKRRRKFFAFIKREGMLIRPVNLCWKSLGEVLFLFSARMALTGLSCCVISASLIKVRGMTMRLRQFTKNLIHAGTSHSLCSPLACGSFDWPLHPHWTWYCCTMWQSHCT